MGEEHLSGALPGEAASEALPGDKAIPRVGLLGVKATLLVALLEDKSTPGHKGRWWSQESRKTHGAALGAKLLVLIAAILLLSTPLQLLPVVKVDTNWEATIETPLTIIALYQLLRHKRVPQ